MKPWLIAAAWALAGPASAADGCEALRSQVEAKIASAGVTRFQVVVVEAAAPTVGQVVGSCDLGSKKLLYQREGGTSAPATAPRGERLLTECKDGSVSVGGDCKP